MTYDCFTFFNELDLLEIRLNILDKVVDKFVLVEATKTHSGKEKPLYFKENKERYIRFLHRIIHIVVDEFPSFETPWSYENHQRNCIVRGLRDAKSTDVIIISDMDEIPNPCLVMKYKNVKGVKLFELTLYYYYLNYLCYTLPRWTGGSKMLSYEDFLTFDKKYKSSYNEYLIEAINQGSTMTKVRCYYGADIVVPNGGWHFSYLGGINAIMSKLKSFAHQEFNFGNNFDQAVVERRIREGRDPFGGSEHFFGVEIDQSYPQYLQENLAKYEPFIFKTTLQYMRKTWLARRYYFCQGWLFRFIVFRLIPNSLHPFLIRIRKLLQSRKFDACIRE